MIGEEAEPFSLKGVERAVGAEGALLFADTFKEYLTDAGRAAAQEIASSLIDSPLDAALAAHETIIAYRYIFSATIWYESPKPYSGVHGLRPVVVVAKRGAVDDWAAYMAGLLNLKEPTILVLEAVCASGAKLQEGVARAFFPTIEGEYRP